MTTTRRGFAKERHSVLKAGVTAVAVAGFGLAWMGFGRAHDAVDDAPPTANSATETPAPTRTPTPTVGTSAAGPTPPTPTSVLDEEPLPLPTRAKRSRAS